MLATAEDVLEITGYSTDERDVLKAQAIIEVYAGRTDSLITDTEDREWMRYAVCWQVAYMSSDQSTVYEQANIQRLSQNDTAIDFGDKAYAVAPLAQQAISRLSWQRSRSIKTSPVYQPTLPEPWGVT